MSKILMLFAAFIVGCSHITYEARPDGATVIDGWEFGTSTALNGATFERLSDGTRRLSLDSYSGNSIDGLKEINQGLSLIIEGAVKGAVP